MAVFVLMLKDFEDEDRVVYLYGPNHIKRFIRGCSIEKLKGYPFIWISL